MNIYDLSRNLALYSLCIFRRHFLFNSFFVICSCDSIFCYITFREQSSSRRRRDISCSRSIIFSCFTDIHHFRICWRIRLDYTRQPSLQTFRPGCLVNYTLSLSNADPAYRNKGRSVGER